MHDPEAAAEVFSKYLQDEDREHLVVLMLDAKKRAIGIHTVSIGTLTQTLVHPLEVFKAAIVSNADAIIIGHNHPSGDAKPSIEDIEITRDLILVGDHLRIPVLDHIIVGHDGSYTSLCEEEFVKPSENADGYTLAESD